MNIRLQWIVGILLVSAIWYVIHKIRTGKADLRYTLIWLILGVVFLAFDMIPQLQILISQALGINSSQNMLIFMSLGFLLVLLFNLTLIVSQQTKRIERLIQENALLAWKVENEGRFEENDSEK
ncbi:DUF2304 domain-containing protein [Baileyella intestinalis]|uniref:DUF2304 domain-containing protein n=1 Tax=Baileyella intestinalis TaxID=2606709 RepID=UPI003A8AE7A5